MQAQLVTANGEENGSLICVPLCACVCVCVCVFKGGKFSRNSCISLLSFIKKDWGTNSALITILSKQVSWILSLKDMTTCLLGRDT